MKTEPRDDEKLYSRIIYKSPDDQNLQNMFKKGKSSHSPRKYKKWSPEISYEERIIRKKKREEEYIRKIYPEERPILLVKKKHVFKNLNQAELVGGVPEEETSFKISRNTELLADVEEDINENEKYIRRFTMVHDRHKDPKAHSPEKKEQDSGAVYKVEGIEYLPEGFLELDPLLMKDEFYFDSKAHENMFLKEQRRIKALRRKQYSEKNYLKKRDVTIYVIDQYKDRIIEFLELWYDKYKRKMNESELREVAERLNTNYDNLYNLQELFLKRRRLIRTQQLRDYHMHMGTDRARSPSGNAIPRKIGDYLRAAGEYDPNRTEGLNNKSWGRSKQGNYPGDSKREWARTSPARGHSPGYTGGRPWRTGKGHDHELGYRNGMGDTQRYGRSPRSGRGLRDTSDTRRDYGYGYPANGTRHGYPANGTRHGYPANGTRHGYPANGSRHGPRGRGDRNYGYKMPIRKSAEAYRGGPKGNTWR